MFPRFAIFWPANGNASENRNSNFILKINRKLRANIHLWLDIHRDERCNGERSIRPSMQALCSITVNKYKFDWPSYQLKHQTQRLTINGIRLAGSNPLKFPLAVRFRSRLCKIRIYRDSLSSILITRRSGEHASAKLCKRMTILHFSLFKMCQFSYATVIARNMM